MNGQIGFKLVTDRFVVPVMCTESRVRFSDKCGECSPITCMFVESMLKSKSRLEAWVALLCVANWTTVLFRKVSIFIDLREAVKSPIATEASETSMSIVRSEIFKSAPFQAG